MQSSRRRPPPRSIPRLIECGYRSPTFACNFSCTQYRFMEIHNETVHNCSRCGLYVDNLEAHRPHCPQRGMGGQRHLPLNLNIEPFREIAHALRGTLLSLSAPIIPSTECQVATVFQNLYPAIVRLLDALIIHFTGLRVCFRLVADMFEATHHVVHERDVIGSPFITLTHRNFIPRVVTNSCAYIIDSLNLYLRNSSMWQILQLHELQIQVGEYQPVIRGRGYVPLPPELCRRKGLISIKSGTRCFQLSVICGVYEDEILSRAHAIRTGKVLRNKCFWKVDKRILENPKYYPADILERLDFSFLPHQDVSILDIDLVEEQFPDISVTVYGNRGPEIFVLRNTRQLRRKHINLLLIKHPQLDQYHYIYIRKISALLGKRGIHQHRYCQVCQKRFDLRSWSSLTHECGENSTIVKPPIDKYVKFRRFDALLKAPFVLFYKIFFITVKTKGARWTNQQTGAVALGEFIPIAFSMLCVGTGSELLEHYNYIGEDCINVFLIKLMNIAKDRLDEVKFTNKFHPLSEEDKRYHSQASKCEICGKQFDNVDVIKTLHHDHFSGVRMQRACVNCNLQVKRTNTITAITLCSKNEFKYLLRFMKPQVHGTATPIKRREGNIIGIALRKKLPARSGHFEIAYGVKLVDLLNYRPDTKLADLISELELSGQQFPVTHQLESQLSGKGDGYYLDIHSTRVEGIEQTFDSIEDFLAKKDKCANDNSPDSCLEQVIVNKVNAEAGLIADVFEAFRREYWKEFALDLASFWSIASFCLEAALLWEKCKLECVTDPEIDDLITRGIFGPIMQVTKLKSISNCELLSNFDPSQEPVQIFYADIVSCYSKCLMGNLPVGEFKKMTIEELRQFDFSKTDFNEDWGYIFEVNLDYQNDDIRDWISEFPFPQERRTVKFPQLSPAQRQTFERSNSGEGKTFLEIERVLQTLYKKEKQIYYGKMLKWMLDHGAVITEIFSGVRFREAPIFSSFATNNVIARNEARNELERQTRKILNNALYGQMLKKTADYPRSIIVRSSVQAKRELAKDTFQSFEILDEDSALFELKKVSVVDRNLRLIGLAILSNAKISLFSHYYDGLKQVFGDRCHHVFTHTDSLVAEIHYSRREYVAGLKYLENRFDFSNMKETIPELYSLARRGIPGLLKIQADGIREFFSTGPCQYSILVDPAFEENKIIRVGGVAREDSKNLRHSDFKRVVENGETANRIRIKSVRILENAMLQIESSHVSLSGLNISRFQISPTMSLPFGDKKINEYTIDECGIDHNL